ncbi:MAG: hypothetical protein ABFE01_15170 [Phycisphaerales bacterium]|jgi:hypothetical protein
MNGVGSAESSGFNYTVPGVSPTAEGQQTTNQEWKRIGMEDPLKLSTKFLTQALNAAGFVDIHAGGPEKIEQYLKNQLAGNEPEQGALDPITASELAAYMGAQIAADVNGVLRLVAQIDPARVAALLK